MTTIEILMKLLGVEGVRSGMQQVKNSSNELGNSLNSVFATGGKFGLGLFGAGSALALLRNEIRHVAEDISTIPGIPQTTIESIRRAQFEMRRTREEIDRSFIVPIVQGAAGAGSFLRDYFNLLKGGGLSGGGLSSVMVERLFDDKAFAYEKNQPQRSADARMLTEYWKGVADEQRKAIATLLEYERDYNRLVDLRAQGAAIGETPGVRADRLKRESENLFQRSTGEAPEVAIKTQTEAQQKLNEARKIEYELNQRGAALGQDQVRYAQERLPLNERLARIMAEIHEIERSGLQVDLSTNAGTEAAIKREERLLQLKREKAALELEQSRLGADRNSFGGQIGEQVDTLFQRWGTLAQQTGRLVADTLGSAVDGIGYSVARAVVYTGNLKQGFLEVAQTISFQVVQALVNMFTTWVAQRAVAAAKSIFFSQAEGAADAAAKAPGALLTSITTFGVAPAVGLAALLAAMGAFGGFAGGGWTGDMGRSQIAGVVHGQEYVLPADFVSAVGRTNLDRAVYGGSYVAGQGGYTGPASGAAGGRGLAVGFFDERRDLRSFLRTHEGKQVLVQAINDSRGDLLL